MILILNETEKWN